MTTYTFSVDSADRSALLPYGLTLLTAFLSQVGDEFAASVMDAYGKNSAALLRGTISGSAYMERITGIQQELRAEIRRLRSRPSPDLPGGNAARPLPRWMRERRDVVAGNGNSR
jgi:hypothetical protein